MTVRPIWSAGSISTLFGLAISFGCMSAPTADHQAAESSNEPMVAVPAGFTVPAHCVIQADDSDVVDLENRLVMRANGTSTPIPVCDAPTTIDQPPQPNSPIPRIDGWIEDGFVNTAYLLGKLTATWRVPKAPIFYENQTIFLFPAFQDPLNGEANKMILQPVLQYGQAGGDPKDPTDVIGGRNWTLAAWYGPLPGTNAYVHSTPFIPNENDLILGSIAATTCSGNACNWSIGISDLTSGAATSTHTSAPRNFTQVFGGVLEVGLQRYVTDCNAFPASSIAFDNIAVYDQAGARHNTDWLLQSKTTECNLHVVADPNTVHLFY